MTWQVSLAARRQILAAMNRRKRAMTAGEIAQFVGKRTPTVMQMLIALERDGCVAHARGPTGKAFVWRRTGKALRKTPTATACNSTLRELQKNQPLRAAFAELAAAMARSVGPREGPL